MLTERFEICAGSTTGKDHLFIRKPNQDSFFHSERGDLLVGIVCDGCGDPASPYSEIGSRLGCQLVGNGLLDLDKSYWDFENTWKLNTSHELVALHEVHMQLLYALDQFAQYLRRIDTDDADLDIDRRVFHRNRYASVIRDHFLFTIVGYAITPTHALFFSLGDGTLIVNGDKIPIGPFLDNSPPYAAYRLLDSSLVSMDPGILEFKLHKVISTDELHSFLIGSDGAGEIELKQASLMPGGREFLGSIDQFWTNDKFYQNPEMVNRRLAMANADKNHVDWEKKSIKKWGQLLHDDTSLIAGRRKP